NSLKLLTNAGANGRRLVLLAPSVGRGLASRATGRARFAGRVAAQPAGASAKQPLGERIAGLSLSLGQGAAMGGAALGLGALCWYGAGLNSQPSALDKSVAWPAYARQRIRDTYAYLGLGVASSAAATVAAFRSQKLMRLLHSGGWMSILLSSAACIGSCIAVQMLPYQPGLGAKQLAYMGFSGLMGCFIAPVCVLGGPLVLRAALYTGGIFGGLTAVAACAPDKKFLTWGGPLSIGLGVVFVSSLGSAFLGPASAAGLTMYSVSTYGGLLLFSGFLLYDTQLVADRAVSLPHYDPVNQAVHVYMDVLNIFVRIVSIMAGGGRKK
ncbi:hypothetical protein BOX15_Mlig030277g1, partial [Macrostomum lignano]